MAGPAGRLQGVYDAERFAHLKKLEPDLELFPFCSAARGGGLGAAANLFGSNKKPPIKSNQLLL